MSTSEVLTELAAELAVGFPDEVVTQAFVRDVDLSALGVAGTLALITLDNGKDHTRPSTFGPGGLAALDAALDLVAPRAAAGEIVAVGVIGKPFIFAVGADLSGVPAIDSREAALAIGRLGHGVFRRLGELPVPSFAFVNGAAMGGGVEVALHCTYRTISSGVPAVALPECFLGMVPAWGGAYLLPRLIGPSAALSRSSSRTRCPATRCCAGRRRSPSAWPTPCSSRPTSWRSRCAGPRRCCRATSSIERSLAPAARTGTRRWLRPGSSSTASCTAPPWPPTGRSTWSPPPGPAPVTRGSTPRTRPMRTCCSADQLRAGLYAFDLVQKRARKPAGAPDKKLARPVTKVGIVGAGLMAAQIALLFARRLQVPVVMTDLDDERVAKGVGYVHGEIAKLASKGRLSADAASRLTALVTGSVSKATFADADFVIEAVFEELGVKKQVFAEVEAVVRPDCVLATNTSSLSVSAMASDLAHPERVVGFHFFNPVAVLPLVEVVRGGATDDAALATALNVGRSLKKDCVIVADRPAFVVNRLLTRFLGEITKAVDEGTPLEVAEHAADPLGLPMPPFLLLQLVGPAIALHVAQTLTRAFPDRFSVSAKLSARRGGQDRRLRAGPRVRPRGGGAAERRSGDPSTGPEVLAAGAGGPRAGDPDHARRGRRRRAGGHRPVHDPRRGLAVPPGRHHPVPRPGGHIREGNRGDLPEVTGSAMSYPMSIS